MLFPESDKEQKEKELELENRVSHAAMMANQENLARYGAASSEFIKSYTGTIDARTGQEMNRSLKKISQYQINPNDRERNIKQQAGFAEEVLDTAKRNSEEIKKGSSNRWSRVDDLPGHKTNETAFDTMQTDATGKEIPNTGTQHKFIGETPEDTASKLSSKKFQEKYPEGRYTVPKDEYSEVKEVLSQKSEKLKKQIQKAAEDGNTLREKQLRERAEYVDKVNNNLNKSTVTRAEAVDARLHPKRTVLKEITKNGHEVSQKVAKDAATTQVTVSTIKNTLSVLSGKKDASQAAVDTLKDTTKAAGRGYIEAQAENALAATLQTSSNKLLADLGKSSAPMQIVSFVGNGLHILHARLNGEITDEQCYRELAKSGINITVQGAVVKAGEKAVSNMVGGTVGKVLGKAGGVVGSLIAGVVIDAGLNYIEEKLQRPKIARQERMQLEALYKELHRELELYQEEFRRTYMADTEELTELFGDSMQIMAQALKMNDADAFIRGSNQITTGLGGKTQFNSVDEFQDFLDSDEAFEL